MNPDQSIIPVWGSIRRTGASIGSVAWIRKAETWLRPVGSTQDINILPRTSAHNVITRNWRKFRTNAIPTAGSLPVDLRTLPRPPRSMRRMDPVVIVRPFAKERTPDADDRGAFLDREFEVVGHAHRELQADGRAGRAEALGQHA